MTRLDAGAVVPGAVEEHDLAAGRQVLHVALEVPLALLDRSRLLERDDARAAWVEMLHEALDRAALARRVTSFEQDDDALARFASPTPAASTARPAGGTSAPRTPCATSGCGTGRRRVRQWSTSSSSELIGIVPYTGSSCSRMTRRSGPKSSGDVPASTASSQRATAAISSGCAFASTSRTALTLASRATSSASPTSKRSIPAADRSGEMSPSAVRRESGVPSEVIAARIAGMADDDLDVAGAWRAFCRARRRPRRAARSGPVPGDRGRSGALCARHLARQLVMALQAELEFGDAANPLFHRYEEPWVQWGGPNPDNVYTRAAIDPDGDVPRVRQRRGRARRDLLARRRRHAPRPVRRVLGVHARRSRRRRRTARSSCGSRPNRHDAATGSQSHRRRAPVPRSAVPLRLGARPRRDARRSNASTRAASRRRRSTAAGPRRPRSTAPRRGSSGRSSTGARTSSGRARRSRATRSRRPATPQGGAPTIAYGAGWWELEPGEALLDHDRRPRRRLLGLDACTTATGSTPATSRTGRRA